jgi:predicted dehydrogenase
VLVATQIAAGEANNIRVRVYGEKGGVEWRQMDPNILLLKWNDQPTQIIDVGNNAPMAPDARCNTRTPAGHPEGFLEAFANIYRNFANTVQAKIAGEQPDQQWADFPNVNDGVRGMQFIETVVTAGWNNDVKWVKWIE